MLNLRYISVLFILTSISVFSYGQVYQRTDTLFIPETNDFPVIDGKDSDASWDLVSWKPISQIWMPYNNEQKNLGQETGLQLWEGADDFTGKYKVVWSSETNLLYFVVEVIDDVFTDGFVYNENPNSSGGYPNYDILEVFIDEDRSGGLHVFDGTGSVATQWGSNAENAFSYHLAINAPDAGNVQTEFSALDIAGTNWGYPNQKVANYISHFPGFAVTRDGSKFTWEFSMRVHNSSYNHANQEASLVTLQTGKVLGLSLAYCDNDNPTENPLSRDHFFGSVEVPLAAHNDHWKQANWFGVAKLAKNPSTFSHSTKISEEIKIKSYASNGRLYNSVNSPINGKVSIRVLNLFGKEILAGTDYKSSVEWTNQVEVNGWKSGIYLVEIVHGNKRTASKFILP